jgi:hypothetical protein
VLADAGLEPHSPIAEPACLVLEGAEDPAGEARASPLRHDVHAPDLGRLRVEAAHASAGDIRAVQGADEEDSVRQLEVGRGWLAPGSGPAVPLQELCSERRRERARRLAAVGLALYLDPARVPFRPAVTVNRPLGLTELLAETVRLYGERIWAVVGMGVFLAGALLLGSVIGHLLALIALVAPAITATYGVAARIAVGDPAREAWAQVGLRAPVLLPLALVVSVPFVLGIVDVIVLVFAVAWLAFVGLSIPVAMIERAPEGTRWYEHIAYALTRGSELARKEYLHVLGITAALVLIYAILGPILTGLLTGFGDNGALVASVIANGVIGPFFFLGLSLLYFEQNARALSSPPKPKT